MSNDASSKDERSESAEAGRYAALVEKMNTLSRRLTELHCPAEARRLNHIATQLDMMRPKAGEGSVEWREGRDRIQMAIEWADKAA